LDQRKRHQTKVMTRARAKKFSLLSLLLVFAGNELPGQASVAQGTWSARASTGLTLAGTWTAVPGPTTETVTGTWTLVNAQGATVAGGGWSASKSPDGWLGNWRAANFGGTEHEFSGSWRSSVDLKASARFADLFEKAAQNIVNGTWRLGSNSGGWSIKAQPTAASSPPTRDPNTPGFVTAKELPDGSVPSPNIDGNFIIGPTHTPAVEMVRQDGAAHGTIHTFTMNSADSKIFPGIARDSGTFGAPNPKDPAILIVTTSHPRPYTRTVQVYVPAQYVPGTEAPFIVGADGPDPLLFTALDNLIAQKRVPPMIAISIGNGSGDAQGSERGLEYDTMSGRYAEFIESEVLPLVERQYNVKLTKDPEGRATMGGSSGGIAAFIMAWYHPELYHRVLAYSITAINQQWPHNAETPHGAWEFHEHLIPNSPRKPIRVWMEVGDRDLLNPNVMRDDMHDWVVASERMARVLAAKGYHYQFLFARNSGHTDRTVKQQTLPEALEWLWKGYREAPVPEKRSRQ
jgi:iron(III)-enterobactin esterase